MAVVNGSSADFGGFRKSYRISKRHMIFIFFSFSVGSICDRRLPIGIIFQSTYVPLFSRTVGPRGLVSEEMLHFERRVECRSNHFSIFFV